MTPRRPENTPSESPDQGQLFGVELHGNGLTDPDQYATMAEFSEPTGDVYPSEHPEEQTPAAPLEDTALLRAVHEANIRDKRSRSQRGKHTARLEDGTYGSPEPGQFLPNFGPVTYRNLEQAKQYIARLNAEQNS